MKQIRIENKFRPLNVAHKNKNKTVVIDFQINFYYILTNSSGVLKHFKLL